MSSFIRRFYFFTLVITGVLHAADRPNILWIVTEDNVATTVGPYGDPLARTPNINRIATGGIVFDRC